MKKPLKIVCKVLMWTAVAVVALLLLSPLWIGPVGRIAANVVVPKITGTAFDLGELSVNPYTGSLHVGKVRLENPEGFSDREAVTLDKLDVKLSMASLFTKKILVEDVDISGVYVTYVKNDGRNNFDVIAENASGGPKTEEEKKAEKEAKVEAAKAEEAAKKGEKTEAKDDGKKVVIARLAISGVKVKVSMVTIPVPPITLTDIGKESEGATFAEIWQQILNVVFKSCGALGDAVVSLGSGLVEGVGAVGGAAVDAAGATAGAVGDAAKSVGGAAADAAGAAAGAVGDAVKGTGNMIKGLFK